MKEKREQKTVEQAWEFWIQDNFLMPADAAGRCNEVGKLRAIEEVMHRAFLAGAKSREGK